MYRKEKYSWINATANHAAWLPFRTNSAVRTHNRSLSGPTLLRLRNFPKLKPIITTAIKHDGQLLSGESGCSKSQQKLWRELLFPLQELVGNNGQKNSILVSNVACYWIYSPVTMCSYDQNVRYKKTNENSTALRSFEWESQRLILLPSDI